MSIGAVISLTTIFMVLNILVDLRFMKIRSKMWEATMGRKYPHKTYILLWGVSFGLLAIPNYTFQVVWCVLAGLALVTVLFCYRIMARVYGHVA